MLKVITNDDRNDEEKLTLESIARAGAKKMLQKAIEGEVLDYLALFADERDEDGRQMVVRNGKGRPRKIAFGAGKIELSVPRVLDRRAGEKFTGNLLPPYMRRSPQLSEALPVLYLKGISSGDFREALAGIMGAASGGFSASVISRLKSVWEEELQNADTRELALEEMKRFAGEYGAKHPKAVECLEKDKVELLAFYDFPAEHWGHLRTTNPIESPFATVRLRTKKTKGAGSTTTAMTMAFKLLESAEKRWRKINAPHQARKLWQGVKFTDGIDLTSSERVAA